MIAARACLLMFCASTCFADDPVPDRPSFVQLAKVGQSARVMGNNGKWNITLLSKARKLEILAQHNKTLQAFERRKKEPQPPGLIIQAPQPSAGLGRIVHVGPDFIAIAYQHNETQTTCIPSWSISRITIEQTKEEAERGIDPFH